jgi:hypothetical protein
MWHRYQQWSAPHCLWPQEHSSLFVCIPPPSTLTAPRPAQGDIVPILWRRPFSMKLLPDR